MSIRWTCLFAVAFGGLWCSVPVQGQILESIAKDFKRNNCWPQPFVCPDRQAVRAPFVVMVNNGWRRQNILGDYHFKTETGELTEAGKLKVRWILTQAPPQHRIIFVNRAMSPAETAARMDTVQQLAAEYTPGEPLPRVIETDLPAAGWPADQIDKVARDFFEKTAITPRLPESQGAAGGKK
jgi:hypothetical protein